MGTRRPLEIRWSALADGQLQAAIDFSAADNPRAATVVRRRILSTVEMLGKMPSSGRLGRIDGTREAVVPSTPYIVVYQVSVSALDVLGVWHGASDWPRSFVAWNPRNE